jgi:acylphosphatase
MDVKKKMLIKGKKVHDVGYRPFLLGTAESIGIESFFADNIFINKKQAVYALVDSSEEKVEAFIAIASSKFPEKSDVEKVDVEDYSGNVMRIESYYRYLTAMQLSKIATYGGKMLEKQDMHIKITQNGFNDMRIGFGEVKEGMAKGFGEVKEEIHLLRDDFRELFMHEVRELRSEVAEIKATLTRMQAAG